MGCIQSLSHHDDLISKNIEKNLKKSKEKSRKMARILLLGAGESGKSTVIKQMKIIHGKGFTEEEKKNYLPIIFNNILQSAFNLILAMENLNIKAKNVETETTYIDIMDAMSSDNPKAFLDVSDKIIKLWNDPAVQECFQRRNEFQINDSTAYYMERIPNYIQDGYIPTNQDVICSRVKTTGISESEFLIKNLTIRMIDVGGQRSERKKWIHCFENVNAILFITAMSEFNMVLEEDNETNRMRESLKLFDSIANNNFFMETAIIIFFNKKDIFEEKLKQFEFTTYFPEYENENNDFDSVSSFIQQMFRSRNRVPGKRLYPHFTTATNTENITFVFNSVIDVVSNINLKEVGLV